MERNVKLNLFQVLLQLKFNFLRKIPKDSKALLLGIGPEINTNSPRPLQEYFLPLPHKEEEKICGVAQGGKHFV